MQKPIEKRYAHSLLSMLKDNLWFNSDEHTLKIQPQMPAKQISHFAKKSIQNQKPIIIQLNNLNKDNNVSEITGTPFISFHSSHLILKESNKVFHLVKANTIRHIRIA